VAQQTTILDNGMSSKVLWAYQNSNGSAGSSNVTSKQEYDFSGNLARETTATYQTSAAYISLNITDRPLSVKVYGAGGAASGPLLAQTNFAYDSTTLSTSSGSAGNSVIGATSHDDVNYGAGKTIRGNLTSVSQMVSAGNFITTKTNYYNILGEVIQTTDGRGNSTLFDFTDKWAPGTGSCVPGSTFAYPTTVIYPATVSDKTVTTYNACDGTVYSTQDQNDLNAGRTGTVFTYDGLQRVTNVSFPDGGSEQTNYGGSANPQVISKTKALTSTSSMTSNTTLDGLGRVVQTSLTSDPDCSGGDKTDRTYDNLGRLHTTSNPYCSATDSTYGLTTLSYDALGRTTQVVPPDGSTSSNNVSTTYSGNITTVTDQAGKSRKSITDALGRLVEVDEPVPGTPGTGQVTISGHEQKIINCTAPVGAAQTTSAQISCPYLYDAGTIYVTVNGYTASANYGQNSTTTTIATALTAGLNGTSSPVSASLSSNVISLTAKTTGSATNYSLSTSADWDSSDFSGPSFQATPSGAALTGGSSAGLTYSLATLYTYDALDNLTTVTQKGGSDNSANWRPRTFTYDGLSRVTSSINPESNTVPSTGATLATTYTYDANGNLIARTSPAPNQTGTATVTVSYCYDA